MLHYISRVIATHVCEYERVEVRVSRKTNECNCFVGSLIGEMAMLRRMQMYIDEDPGNRLLNKSMTILI